jgi:hypothetical protein
VLREEGVLIATKEVGFLAIRTKLDSTRYDTTRVFSVSRWDTNDAGDIVLTVAGVAYDGYQTDDDGFVASSTFSLENGAKRSAFMGAVPYRIPMSNDDGIYTVKVRTRFVSNGIEATSDPTDWFGELAIAFGSGTMYIDMMLHNMDGGSTGFFTKGPLRADGSFDLTSKSGSRLRGTLQHGVLRAEWLDQREDKMAFRGNLVAERK